MTDSYSRRSITASYNIKDDYMDQSSPASTRNSYAKNSYGSPKNSFGSNGSNLSMEYWNVDDSTIDENPQPNGFSMKGPDGKTFVGSFEDEKNKNGQDEFDIICNDPVFKQLFPREKYSNDNQCKICNKKFGKLKITNKRRHCKFCGDAICDDHGRKRRADPQNPTEYFRICDTCDNKYINRIIMSDYSQKVKRKDKEINDLEKKIKEQNDMINHANSELSNLKLHKIRNEKSYADQISYLTNDIAKIRDETKKFDKDNGILSEDFKNTHKEVEELEENYVVAQGDYEKLQSEATQLNHKIDAINQDILHLNREIKRMEEAVAQSKSQQVSDIRTNTFFAGSLLSDNSEVQPGDSLLSVGDTEPKNPTPGHYQPPKLPGKNSTARKSKAGGSGGGGFCFFCIPKKSKEGK